jgi:hypothetical protein
MWVVFGLMFCFIACLMLVGLFSPRFQDNVLQCFGMAVLTVWSMDQASQVFVTRHVSVMQGFVAVGLLLYGSGVATKVYHYRNGTPHERPPSIHRHIGG